MEQWEKDRINELARLKKERSLTKEEEMEQAKLRKRYLQTFREQFRQQLDMIEWVDADDPRLQEKKPSC